MVHMKLDRVLPYWCTRVMKATCCTGRRSCTASHLLGQICHQNVSVSYTIIIIQSNWFKPLPTQSNFPTYRFNPANTQRANNVDTTSLHHRTQRANNVVTTSLQRHDVAATLYRRCWHVVSHLSFFWYLGRTVLTDCGICLHLYFFLWLEHFSDHENMFEIRVVRVIEC